MPKLIECPRDAMQGLHDYIPAELKAEYINLLLKVGFDTIDFGSFVSPKAVPQLRDTSEVLDMLDLNSSASKLLAIVANVRGAEEAARHEQISYLGFPFSISETFQQRNTNSSIEQSLATVTELLNLCDRTNKKAVIYLSMAFGNPYGDEWNNEIAEHWTHELVKAGAQIISLADTTGVSSPEKINYLFPHLQQQFPGIELGVHLHSTPELSLEKLEAAWNSGCRRFDSALRGYGGCPMATDSLTGNIATEGLISFLERQKEPLNLNMEKWQEALRFSPRIFN
ncbi:hydroxymethylglutaryl-CoA lyase [Daejeonella lutea]|uniref:Hydroxymethylglutaryl-CoA lyase n=1 Tax=Daejeonella lutea TaxID=572036 RepID=A0A1T5AWJ0_9SPHI|nr:hydroxymethylglutaryl-CoA lyase [Daejeonella lutea]SKB39179.1 hydroxymethylglutaryl-CoA lyase [Daejeonella lutea]